jgi:hypothetical protein
MHALIWPLAEATVADALDDLSATERKVFSDLMQRVKCRLLELSEDDPVANSNAISENALSDVEIEPRDHISL